MASPECSFLDHFGVRFWLKSEKLDPGTDTRPLLPLQNPSLGRSDRLNKVITNTSAIPRPMIWRNSDFYLPSGPVRKIRDGF